MTYQAAIFDLDGTLADTVRDIAASANHALAAFGYATHPTDAYRYLAGQGVRRLFIDAIGDDATEAIDTLVAAFKEHYNEHMHDTTGPFAGVPALLNTLKLRGVKLAVLSNKPDAATQDVVRTHFSAWSFDAVRGHRDGTPLKPDPTSGLELAAELGIEPVSCLYAGDTKVDMLTGKAAGFYTVGVTWGFRDEPELRAHGADAIIHTPGALLDML